MSNTSTGGPTADPATRTPARREEPVADPPERTAWTGWIVFAAVMLGLLGSAQMFTGFVAVVDEDYFQQTGAAPQFLAADQQTWGVLQLVLGAAAILTAVGLVFGVLAARVVAGGVVAVGLVSNLLAIGAYPVWSLVLVAVDVLVLHALVVHGREMRRAG